MDYKFAFVILHYITLEDTVECVESILKNSDNELFNIIIVDNASPNSSGKVLLNKYKDYSQITVIINKKNLGFAKGNNVGYNYAKNNFHSDFIILLNNDTYISQLDFIKIIQNKFEELKFHILGPDIISTKDGSHQNPRKLTLQNYSKLKNYLVLYSILLFLNYLYLDKVFENFKKKYIKKPLITPEEDLIPPWDTEQINVKLHGSALVFSPLYVAKYDGLNPDTFMYSEEAILYFTAKRDKLKTVYTPDLQVFHKEDSSTNRIFDKSVGKRRFYYRNFIKSGKVLLKLMENSK